MPTNQPSSAPDDVTRSPAAEPDAAAVLHDERLDHTPGLGGLGGLSAADGASATASTPSGTSPNSPIDIPVPEAASDREVPADAEAKRLAEAEPAPEPHPASQ